MKKYLPLTFLFLLTLSNNAKSQETFKILFPEKEEFYFSEFTKSSVRNDYYFSFFDRNNSQAFGLAKYNQGIKWAKLFNIDSNNYTFRGVNLYPSNDGGLIVTFVLRDNEYNICALKCNSSGNIIWKKILDKKSGSNNSYISIPKVCEAKDGSLYFVFHNYANYYAIIKLNKNAELLWNREFEMDGISQTEIDAVTAAPDNGLLVAEGQSGFAWVGKVTHLQKFDANGNLQWNIYPISGGISTTETMLMKYEGDEIHIILKAYSSNLRSKIMVLNFNEERTKVSANLVTDNYFSLKYYLKSQKADYAKGPISYGSSFDRWFINDDWSLTHSFFEYNDDNERDRFLEKYDVANKLCPSFIPVVFAKGDTSYSVRFEIYPKDELPTPELRMGNLNITSNNYKITYGVVCYGDSESPQTSTNIKTNSSINISIFPNPASHTLKITGLKNDTNISISNMSGSILKKYTANTGTYNINISTLNAGLYTLLISDGKTVVIKKFIKN